MALYQVQCSGSEVSSIWQPLTVDAIELARKAIRQFVAKVVVNEKAGTIYYTFPLADLSRVGLMPPTHIEYISFRTDKVK